jgi:pyridinium-3,5-biscarboxylic acid mononucleotide sulfurtransferase
VDAFLARKYHQLQQVFLQHREVALAFSGGVDSSFLLHAACATLGPSSVHAFHATSELLPPLETARAEIAVRERGCFFHSTETKPFSWPEFLANGPDRCYHCKKKIYQTFLADQFFAKGAVLFDGTNHDDLAQDRPGLRAVSELNVQTPLADIGFTKKEIRLLSREFSLSTWNAHASSCLATRIARWEPIARKKILLVCQCEELLQKLGYKGVRVRLSEETATIAVLQKDLVELQKKHVFSVIKNGFMSLGLRGVALDPQGRPDWAE